MVLIKYGPETYRRISIYRVHKKNLQHLKYHSMNHQVANSDTFQETIDGMSHAVAHKGIVSVSSSFPPNHDKGNSIFISVEFIY